MSLFDSVSPSIDGLLPKLEDIYKHLHQTPELSMQEFKTAEYIADHVEKLGYDVTRNIGGTGLVAMLKNGDGPVVMLRADMDALPVTEDTGLPYASTVTAKNEEGVEVGVAHSCGHDMHVTWLLGACELMMKHKDAWKGTLLAVFQPGEESAQGAQSMIDGGIAEKFPKPDIILGQHVMVGLAGSVMYRPGVILSAGDSMKIQLFGRGAHGSQPQSSIDPVVMAAATTLRLQTIVSREIAAADKAVVTVGSLQAGTKENIIPDNATLKLNVRTYDQAVRDHVIGAIRRICCAECAASNAPKEPEFTKISSYPLTDNDKEATEKLAKTFNKHFGQRSFQTEPFAASEDFSLFGRHWKVPYVFWFIGGTDPDEYKKHALAKTLNQLPMNHSPQYAPVINPTLRTGLEAMVCAAQTWFDKE